MTTDEKNYFIGKKANVPIGSMTIVATILDVRERFFSGLEFYVRPVAGFGRKWVKAVELRGSHD